jgi:hypothetical protein
MEFEDMKLSLTLNMYSQCGSSQNQPVVVPEKAHTAQIHSGQGVQIGRISAFGRLFTMGSFFGKY